MAVTIFNAIISGVVQLLGFDSDTKRIMQSADNVTWTPAAAPHIRDFAMTTLTGAYTPSWLDGDFQRGTLTGDMTLTAPLTIPLSGDVLMLEVTCGSYTLTVGSATYTAKTVIVAYYKSNTSVRVTVTEVTV